MRCMRVKIIKKKILHFARWLRIYVRKNPWVKRVIGVIFFFVGLFALLTPVTPGSWLIVIGLELLGVEILSRDLYEKHKRQIFASIKKILQ